MESRHFITPKSTKAQYFLHLSQSILLSHCYNQPQDVIAIHWLFNTAITTIQTNSAIDQNIWAKTAQAPLNFLEYCSQSVKLHSCAYSCPTYQLCAHKNVSFQIPEYSSTPFCAVKQRVQPCHTNMGIQRRYHSKTLCKGWSYLKAAFLHLALTDQPSCSTCVVPGNKANKPFISTLQFLFQII